MIASIRPAAAPRRRARAKTRDDAKALTAITAASTSATAGSIQLAPVI
jgi:hypothetical protein